MKVIIEPQPHGWVIVGKEPDFTINIHRECDGKAGQLRDAALTVHDLLNTLEPDEEENENS